MRSVILAVLSALTLGGVHQYAHGVYGSSPEAIGSVGLVVLVGTLVGVGVNGAVIASRTDLAGIAFGILAGVSAASAWGIHDVAHSWLGASADAILTITTILAGLAFVGVMLNIGSYTEAMRS